MEDDKRRNKRQGLSLTERIRVIEARQQGKSMRQLAIEFGCGKTQILNTLAQKERYLQEWHLLGARNNPAMGARKRFRHTRNEEINRSLYEWYKQQSADGMNVTGPMLQRQARHLANAFGIAAFAASNGWLANFRRFYNILSANPRKSGQKSDGTGTSGGGRLGHSTHEKLVDAEQLNSWENPTTESLVKGVSEEKSQEESVVMKSESVVRSKCSTDQSGNTSSGTDISGGSLKTNEPNLQVVEQQPFVCQPSASSTTSAIIQSVNHRKRRLLQCGESSQSKKTESDKLETWPAKEESRMKVHFEEFVNLVRSKGLITALVKDDCGNEWLEIRQSVAMYRVPRHDYPTHLSRLIVDSNLQYFLEVLGHCVQRGSFFKDMSSGLNYSEMTSVLCALDGGYRICDGVASFAKRLPAVDAKSAQECGLLRNLDFTLPDHRFRSHDCLKWIDNQLGPSCLPCRSTMSSIDSMAPIDLRCTSHLEQHEN